MEVLGGVKFRLDRKSVHCLLDTGPSRLITLTPLPVKVVKIENQNQEVGNSSVSHMRTSVSCLHGEALFLM